MSCWILGFVLGDFTLSQLCLVAEGCDSFWKWGAKSSHPKNVVGMEELGAGPAMFQKRAALAMNSQVLRI